MPPRQNKAKCGRRMTGCVPLPRICIDSQPRQCIPYHRMFLPYPVHCPLCYSSPSESSFEASCTFETCSNAEECIRSSPYYCPYGFKEEDDDNEYVGPCHRQENWREVKDRIHHPQAVSSRLSASSGFDAPAIERRVSGSQQDPSFFAHSGRESLQRYNQMMPMHSNVPHSPIEQSGQHFRLASIQRPEQRASLATEYYTPQQTRSMIGQWADQNFVRKADMADPNQSDTLYHKKFTHGFPYQEGNIENVHSNGIPQPFSIGEQPPNLNRVPESSVWNRGPLHQQNLFDGPSQVTAPVYDGNITEPEENYLPQIYKNQRELSVRNRQPRETSYHQNLTRGFQQTGRRCDKCINELRDNCQYNGMSYQENLWEPPQVKSRYVDDMNATSTRENYHPQLKAHQREPSAYNQNQLQHQRNFTQRSPEATVPEYTENMDLENTRDNNQTQFITKQREAKKRMQPREVSYQHRSSQIPTSIQDINITHSRERYQPRLQTERQSDLMKSPSTAATRSEPMETTHKENLSRESQREAIPRHIRDANNLQQMKQQSGVFDLTIDKSTSGQITQGLTRTSSRTEDPSVNQTKETTSNKSKDTSYSIGQSPERKISTKQSQHNLSRRKPYSLSPVRSPISRPRAKICPGASKDSCINTKSPCPPTRSPPTLCTRAKICPAASKDKCTEKSPCPSTIGSPASCPRAKTCPAASKDKSVNAKTPCPSTTNSPTSCPRGKTCPASKKGRLNANSTLPSECSCRFPSAFNNFSCTGQITGSCNCSAEQSLNDN